MSLSLRDRSTYRLGFPLHHGDAPTARLPAITAFMDAEGLDPEFYFAGPSVQRLETRVADLLGKEAALWCPTGTMAQGIAARLHAEDAGSRRLLLHPTSHLELHEGHAYKHVHGLEGELIGAWSETLTPDDLKTAGCAVLELPQRHNGGLLPSWETLEALKARAADLGLPLHMDGARLWSCRPAYDDRTYAEICDGFASVYVSLYKDIGALGGAVLAGDRAFIDRARTWRDRMGGLQVSPWPTVPDALRLLDLRLGQMPDFVAHAKRLAAAVSGIDGVGVRPEIPQVNLFHLVFDAKGEAYARARDQVAEETGVWLGTRVWEVGEESGGALETCVGERAMDLPPETFRDAVERLSRSLSEP